MSTIAEVKGKIEAREEIPRSRQRLLNDHGEEMKDEHDLAKYFGGDVARTICVVLKQCGPKEYHVIFVGIRKSVKIFADEVKTVGDMMVAIRDLEGISCDQLRLIFKGRLLPKQTDLVLCDV